jgi:hypothetical protein
VLSGRATSGAVGISNGQVTLDLAPLIAVAKQDLVARGLTIAGKIPLIHVTFALFPSKKLAKAQKAYRLINDLKIVLPIVTLVLLGLGVLAARGHRRALIGAGLGFAASMLVLGAGLAIARAFYLNSVPASPSADAAAAAADILVRFIRTARRTLLVVCLIVAAGAFFTGPSAAAVATPGGVSSGLGRRRGGFVQRRRQWRASGQARSGFRRSAARSPLRSDAGAPTLTGRAGLLLLSGVAVPGHLEIGHLRDPEVISAEEFEREEKAKDPVQTQFHPGSRPVHR